ncbi:hypothetical protein B484DRAFT_143634 [Ochromonadaceae sp. CCMP2298]|nr:hypothetical protein B484DRAFT_143634 [Ochromonadaceae sp. CCMP2298]
MEIPREEWAEFTEDHFLLYVPRSDRGLSKVNLKLFLHSLQIFLTDKTVSRIFSVLDFDKDGRILWGDLMQIAFPEFVKKQVKLRRHRGSEGKSKGKKAHFDYHIEEGEKVDHAARESRRKHRHKHHRDRVQESRHKHRHSKHESKEGTPSTASNTSPMPGALKSLLKASALTPSGPKVGFSPSTAPRPPSPPSSPPHSPHSLGRVFESQEETEEKGAAEEEGEDYASDSSTGSSRSSSSSSSSSSSN